MDLPCTETSTRTIQDSSPRFEAKLSTARTALVDLYASRSDGVITRELAHVTRVTSATNPSGREANFSVNISARKLAWPRSAEIQKTQSATSTTDHVSTTCKR